MSERQELKRFAAWTVAAYVALGAAFLVGGNWESILVGAALLCATFAGIHWGRWEMLRQTNPWKEQR